MSHFRILHLSDFHFGERANTTNVPLRLIERMSTRVPDVDLSKVYSTNLKRAFFSLNSHHDVAAVATAQFCYENQNNYDVVVVTGDLACTGRESDLEVALRFVSSTTQRKYADREGNGSIGHVKRLKVILPGNHDRYKDATVPGLPGGNMFDNLFSAFYPHGQRVFSRTRSKGDSRIGIVCADFTLRRLGDLGTNPILQAYGMLGQGKAHTDVLRDLAQETRDLRHRYPGIYIIWAIHFAPFDCRDSLKFHDYHEVLSCASKMRVEIILCGHTHIQSSLKVGSVNVLCAGSTCCVDKSGQNSLHLIDLRKKKSGYDVRRENFAYQPNDGLFERVDVERIV